MEVGANMIKISHLNHSKFKINKYISMQSPSHTSVDFDLEQIFNDEAQYDINNWD